jgi:CheY-like chemotaxis protein
VVDDEPDVEVLFRQQFRHDLRAGRFTMEFAQFAPMALQRIADEGDRSLILILSDINMPGMSGVTSNDRRRSVVLLSGEAGIGKSRLAAALLEHLAAGEPHTRLRYFCSPQHTDGALYPVIGQMERAAGFVHDDTPQAKLDKLDAVLTQTSTQEAALFAEMFVAAKRRTLSRARSDPRAARKRLFPRWKRWPGKIRC